MTRASLSPLPLKPGDQTSAGKDVRKTQLISNNPCAPDIFLPLVNQGEQIRAESRIANQDGIVDLIQPVGLVLVQPVIMIILIGQQAPVTDPPVHQTRSDGRRQRGGDALRIPVDDFRYLREGLSGRPADRHIPTTVSHS
jgi:hypothetical protein